MKTKLVLPTVSSANFTILDTKYYNFIKLVDKRKGFKMSSPSYADIERFMKNENYPNQFDVSTKDLQQYVCGLPIGLKAFYVNGEPLECTIECDYSTINVSGHLHRIYIVGICNQVTITGTFHTLYFEGSGNRLNYCNQTEGGQIVVQGSSPFSYAVGLNNGQILSQSEGAIMPTKLDFPESLKTSQRRRVQWQPIAGPGKQSVKLDDDEDENM